MSWGRSMFATYVKALGEIVSATRVTTRAGAEVALDKAVKDIGVETMATHEGGNKLIFVGNGGSASICGHMATDFNKNGGVRATTLNDAATLTCLANDYGYENVFAKQIQWHAASGDLLIAISSSGRSQNILNAVEAARNAGCRVITMSGFRPDNPLRRLGDLNLYVASQEYGFVEVGHLAILHGILDIQMGWGTEEADRQVA